MATAERVVTAPAVSQKPSSVLLTANAIVFGTSLSLMALELVAARLLATNIGASLYTWTSVIGVVLGGLSLGNYIGGRLADRTAAPRRTLGRLFLFAAVLSLSVLWLNQFVGGIKRPEAFSLAAWVFTYVAATFFLPACTLGTFSPVAAKMALEETRHTGATVGNIYAWGAVGSIAGTFLAGFLLINWLGTRGVVCAISAGLALPGVLFSFRPRRRLVQVTLCWLPAAAAVTGLAAGPWPWAKSLGALLRVRDDVHKGGSVVYYDESSYHTIQVKVQHLGPNPVKTLKLDNLVHSAIHLQRPFWLVYEYEQIYAAVTHRTMLTGRPARAFFIGGGGFVFPRYFERTYPGSRIDVAEIDPGVKLAAQREFGLPPDDRTRIRTHLMDARNFVDDQLRRNASAPEPVLYDFIYGDAFNHFSVPFHLTTREFNERLKRLMPSDGVYLINVLDIYREGLGRFLGAYVATARETFSNVYVFSTRTDGPTQERETFVVACSDRPLDLNDLALPMTGGAFPGRLFAWAEGNALGGEMATLIERGRGVILTDDYAPVDNLLAPVASEP